MTLYAITHGYPDLLAHHVALSDWPMTSLAIDFRSEMLFMAEVHIIRKMVNTNPGYRFAIFLKLRKSLNQGAICFDRAMASHAFVGCRKPHVVAGLGHFVTVLAFQAQSQMFLVAVRNRLFRSWGHILRGRRRRLSGCTNGYKHERQKSPAHWCSMARKGTMPGLAGHLEPVVPKPTGCQRKIPVTAEKHFLRKAVATL